MTNESKRWEALQHLTVTESKYFVSIFHLEFKAKISPDWIYHLQNQRKVMFHYAEGLQEHFENTDLHFSNPYKLSYWIEYSEKLQSFKVTQKAIIGCKDHAGYFNHMKHSCKMHMKSQSGLQKCISIAENKYSVLKDVVILKKDLNVQTMKYTVQISCSNQVIQSTGNALDSYSGNF